MNGNKVFSLILAALTLLNLAGFWILYGKTENLARREQEVQYTLFIGLNDKDSNQQELTDEQARSLVESVCAEYTDGFTLQDATGMWTDESGGVVHENTIVCILSGTGEETVRKIADGLLEELNQSTILIQRETLESEYYSGQ